ncbi:MAG: F0F1 ATP synthase subunit A [Candidatus Sungbacteria bacterium]|nr:F0F1 ATP synthase subunit A [Candidatus Sungbacteria bacterium]
MPPIQIAAEKLFFVSGFPVTNTLIASWLVIGLLLTLGMILTKSVALVPGYAQNIFEIFVEGFLGIMAGIFGSREKAEQYFPLIATIFLFILVSNWSGILPGVGSLGFFEQHGEERIFVPLLRSAASDLNVTLALATITVFLIHVSAVVSLGLRSHLGKFFSLKGPIEFFVGILEFISEFARIISFSFRLFGNIFAGEVLLVVTGLLVPYLVPVPFLALELFVGFIQALVFAMLTMVFMSIAVAHH